MLSKVRKNPLVHCIDPGTGMVFPYTTSQGK